MASDRITKILITGEKKDSDLKVKIKELLEDEENHSYRDNVSAVMAHLWFLEAGDNLQHMTAFDFLENFSTGKYTSPEKIASAMQEVQRDNENLRGHKYEVFTRDDKKVRGRRK